MPQMFWQGLDQGCANPNLMSAKLHIYVHTLTSVHYTLYSVHYTLYTIHTAVKSCNKNEKPAAAETDALESVQENVLRFSFIMGTLG